MDASPEWFLGHRREHSLSIVPRVAPAAQAVTQKPKEKNLNLITQGYTMVMDVNFIASLFRLKALICAQLKNTYCVVNKHEDYVIYLHSDKL